MAQTGRIPCVARPAAKVTACPSAMPTSKNRSGYFSWNTPVPVPEGMAAVMATSSGCSPARAVRPRPEHLGPGGRAARLLSRLAGDRIVRRQAVPLLLVGLGKGEALPLLGDDVNHPGALHATHELQGIAQLGQIVAVDRPEVPEAQLLEQHAGREQILDALLDVAGKVHQTLAEHSAQGKRQSLDPLAQLVGARVGHDPAQHLADGADVGGDGHPIVVDDEDDVPLGVSRVVHPLVRQAAGERAIAHDGHHLVLLTLEVARRGHAERGRHGGARVAGAELVVLALASFQKAGDPVALAQAGKLVVASGQKLPGIGLMPDIPDDLVNRRLELIEQRDGELDHPEARADVPAGDRAALDQPVADLLRQLGQLVALEAFQVWRET